MSDDGAARLLDAVHAAGVDFLHLQFTDVPGTIKTVAVPARRLPECLERGVWFDGSTIEGRARVAETDLFLRPDPDTFALVTWDARPMARVLCDVYGPDGAPFLADPRGALKAVLAEARALGLEYRVGCEVEFFILDDAAPGGDALAFVDQSSYFEVPADRAAELCRRAVSALMAIGFGVDGTHHEVAPGQYEIDLTEQDALRAADAVVTLKWALRALGRPSRLLVSFMPKPAEALSGSGLHFQQVLVDTDRCVNAFAGPDSQYHLSGVGREFIAGQLAHARGMCAVLAPLVNSYKRLMGGAEAPARICWAHTNHAALVRVPQVQAKEGARIELRAPDPSCNPYLALAAMLKAGLDGIANNLPLPEPIEEFDEPGRSEEREEEGANPLPATLAEALEELEWDPVIRAALGQPIYERFLAAKEQEWLAYRRHISDWELQRYLEGA
jgi:glutamine synthetase